VGPIPARAGQPSPASHQSRAPRAYPRSRGATDIITTANVASRGLSPLARGNPAGQRRAARAQRPIPARAGQPRPQSAVSVAPRAYPRSRGATRPWLCPAWSWLGLSPLARGNR